MEKFGVRNLQIHASEIVRRVREGRETFELTYRRETIGQIVPLKTRTYQEVREEYLKKWEALIDNIAAHRIDNVSAEETMREIRRDL